MNNFGLCLNKQMVFILEPEVLKNTKNKALRSFLNQSKWDSPKRSPEKAKLPKRALLAELKLTHITYNPTQRRSDSVVRGRRRSGACVDDDANVVD